MYFDQTKEAVLESLGTDERKGLSREEAAERLSRHGPNKLKEEPRKSLLAMFIAQLNEPLVLILLVAALVSALVGEVSDAVIIGLVVLLNAVIGVSQESKAEKSMEALKKLSTPRAYVLRGGETVETDSEELVPGDVVVLDAGRFIPCDLRLLETASLRVDESALTGESVPVEKDATLVCEPDMPLGDRRNMVFSSTLVVAGRGRGVVVGTGMDTEIGRIAGMLGEKEEKTPLQKKLAETGKVLTLVALGVCAVMFVVGALQGRPLFEMFMTAISLAVAAIPEGMPAIVSIVLALGVQRMARKNAIIRKLPSVETLGAVNVICSDKTGTLTQNKMTVMKFYVDRKIIPASELDVRDWTGLLLMEALMLCNDATSDGETGTGDPTEIALIDAGLRHGLDAEALNIEHRRVDELPFDSDRKLMSTVNVYGDTFYVMTKGAADALLERSTHIMIEGRPRPLSAELRQEVLAAAEAMSDDALRVLGVAWKKLGSEPLEETELTFLGLVAMIDPPRLVVRDSIDICKKAGIATVMITGDHRQTALAIARDLGIAETEEETATGAELDAMDETELIRRSGSLRVYSRVSPEHKVRIVKALKVAGNVVSMTGDGVNDAPSLKAADIGVAMGITGTDVAKGASDMVLTDDNFSTIVAAVEEGRNIFVNIKKSILFLISCNLGEIAALFAAVLLGWPAPLLPIHLLWVNLITDTFPALSLGVDPGDPDVMNLPPRRADESLFHGSVWFLIRNGLIIGLLTIAAFLIGLMYYSHVY
ncbi:MAG: HAD-IC family P-type ATPase, partial [Fretibacterium sp.]|nr:HAD-IC family P-type ATPase [Fretibacterium sp.]